MDEVKGLDNETICPGRRSVEGPAPLHRPPQGCPQATPEPSACPPVRSCSEELMPMERTATFPDGRSYRRIFPDVGISISQHGVLLKDTFHKMPVLEEIIVGFQKKRKAGWLNISALFEKPQKPQQEQM